MMDQQKLINSNTSFKLNCMFFIFKNLVLSFSASYSMGLAGVRNSDNMNFFEEKKPLCVVYYEIDYSMNPKGKCVQDIHRHCYNNLS